MDLREKKDYDDISELEDNKSEDNISTYQTTINIDINADISNIDPVGTNDINNNGYYTSSDLSYQNQAEVSTPGRTKLIFTFILEYFFISNSKHPKREYFNAFIIRSIKKTLRCAISGCIPKTTAIAVHSNNNEEMKLWNLLQALNPEQPVLIKKNFRY